MKTIYPRIHGDALSSISRLFDGKGSTIAFELLQNARRAGAKEIQVELSSPSNHPDTTIVVKDDGAGVARFDDILDAGNKHTWGDHVHAEDPAGMGVYSLACSTSPIRYTSRGQVLTIPVEALMGKPGAGAELCKSADTSEGTTVRFSLPVGKVTYLSHRHGAGANRDLDAGDSRMSFSSAVRAFGAFCEGIEVFLGGQPVPKHPILQKGREFAFPQHGARVRVMMAEKSEWGGNMVLFQGQPVISTPCVPSGYMVAVFIDKVESLHPVLPARDRLMDGASTVLEEIVLTSLGRFIKDSNCGHHLPKSTWNSILKFVPGFPEASPRWEALDYGGDYIQNTNPATHVRAMSRFGGSDLESWIVRQMNNEDCPLVVVNASPGGYSWENDLPIIEDAEVIVDYGEKSGPIAKSITLKVTDSLEREWTASVDCAPVVDPDNTDCDFGGDVDWNSDWYVTKDWVDNHTKEDLHRMVDMWFSVQDDNDFDESLLDAHIDLVWAKYFVDGEMDLLHDRISVALDKRDILGLIGRGQRVEVWLTTEGVKVQIHEDDADKS